MECSIKNDDLIRECDSVPLATYCDECGLWRAISGDVMDFSDRDDLKSVTIDGFMADIEFCSGHESDGFFD